METIPEIELIMNPKSPEARSVIGFQWNSTAGRAHKIGGHPDWLSTEDTPVCNQCSNKMTFYGQLDCLGDSVPLGDCGRIFVFVCMDCLATRSVLQCG